MRAFRILRSLLFLFGCCLMLAACGKKTEVNTEIDSSSTPKDDESGFSQKMGEGGQMGDALPLTGKALGELPVVGEEDTVYCNLPENVQSWEAIVPLCVDPRYGILYYVDYGGDYMIHAIYNGESQTVLELPGKRLFCREGKLYFLLESYNRFRFEGAESGNIAEYDPVTGNVKILVNEVFDSIVVYQDMIYCQCQSGTQSDGEILLDKLDYWFYFFDKDELIAAEEPGREYALDFRRYGEYFLAATLQELERDPRYDTQVGTELRKWNGERGTVWDGLLLMPFDEYFIKNGKFHWRDAAGFHIWEPVSGQEEIYPWEVEHFEHYILVENLIFNTNFQLMDLEKGSMEKWSSRDNSLKMIHELYTDGSQIYAIVGGYASEVNKNSVFRKVQVTQGEYNYEVFFEKLSE